MGVKQSICYAWEQEPLNKKKKKNQYVIIINICY